MSRRQKRNLKKLSLTRDNHLRGRGKKRRRMRMSTSMTGMVSIARGKIRRTRRMKMTTMMSLGVES